MSRSLPALLALATLSFLVLPASAQANGSGTLTIQGLEAHYYPHNQTQLTIPFTVKLDLAMGTCMGGTSQFAVTLSAEKSGMTPNSTVSVAVQPATLNFQVPQTTTLAGAYSSSEGAVVVVSPGVIRDNVTTTVTVKATASPSCSVPGAGSPGTLNAQGQTTVHFVPVADELSGSTTDAVPGLGLPALLAVIGIAFLLRRRAD